MNNTTRTLGILFIFLLFVAMTPRETFWVSQTWGSITKIGYTARYMLFRKNLNDQWAWNTEDKYMFGIEGTKENMILRMPWAQGLIPPLASRHDHYNLIVEAAPVDGVTLTGSLCGRTFALPGAIKMSEKCFMAASHLRIEAEGKPEIIGNRLNYAAITRIALESAK